MFPLNMFRVIVQYYYEELTNKTIVILLIMFATTVIYISALKIITTLDYLHIFIADMGAQIIAGTFVEVCLYYLQKSLTDHGKCWCN